MPFYISSTDPGVSQAGVVQLSPAPVRVEYPNELLGEVQPTPDGRAIVQQPSQDARRRAWVWERYPSSHLAYERQYQQLLMFRSRYRQAMGVPPYVWVKDTTTQQLRRRNTSSYAAAGTGNTTTVIVGGTWTAGLLTGKNAYVEVTVGTGIGQRRRIVSNTTNSITVDVPFDTIPNGATLYVVWWSDDWFRARVIDVNRKLRDDGGNVRYDTTTLAFVIEDSGFNALG